MKELQEMAEAFADSHPENVARLLELELVSDSAKWLEKLSDRVAARVVQKMLPLSAANCLAQMDLESSTKVLALVEMPLAIGILRRIRIELRSSILKQLPSDYSEKISGFLSFSEDTAAALADPSVLTIPDDLTIQDAETIYRKQSKDAHYYLYVLDREQRLVGVVSLRDLTMNEGTIPVSRVMAQSVSSIPATSPQRSVLEHSGWREFHAMPVIDSNQKFLGAIRYETLRQLEAGLKSTDNSSGAKQAGHAFGELYWLGLSGIFQGVGATLSKTDKNERGNK